MTIPRSARIAPVARLRTAGLALLANLAAIRAHRRVESTQNIRHQISGAPPMAKWLAAPVSAVKVIMNTLVPTAVLSS